MGKTFISRQIHNLVNFGIYQSLFKEALMNVIPVQAGTYNSLIFFRLPPARERQNQNFLNLTL